MHGCTSANVYLCVWMGIHACECLEMCVLMSVGMYLCVWSVCRMGMCVCGVWGDVYVCVECVQGVCVWSVCGM